MRDKAHYLLEPLDTVLKGNKIAYIIVYSNETTMPLFLYEQLVGGACRSTALLLQRHCHGARRARRVSDAGRECETSVCF